MRRLLIAAVALLVTSAAWATPPAGFNVRTLGGDLAFTFGGMDPEYLTGAFVKTATVSGDTLTITAQGTDGNDLPSVTFTGVANWIDLSDTPDDVTADLCVKGNGAGDALVFGTCTSAGAGDGVVDSFEVAGSVLTIERTEGLGDLTVTLTATNIPDLPADKIVSGTFDDARIPAGIARDSELPDVSDFQTESEVDARIATYARVSPSGTIATAQLPSANALDSELPDVSDFVTATDVDGVFDSALFSNVTRDLVFGHYGSGTSTIPLDFLNSTNDARPAAITNVTVEQGDTVILSSGIYMYLGSVVTTIAKTSIAADDDFVQIDASGGGLTIEDSGTEEGTGITTLNFGANLGVTITGTQADIAGQAGGGGGLASVTSDATLDGDGTNADPLGVADGGIGNAQMGVNSVHNAQMVDNSVRGPEIQARAVTVEKMNSGTATDGHVATADGSGGVAYEAAAGGTDDQTAAEVTVTATGFAGNLSGTDTDVQTALDTIDGFTLGGGGGVSTFIALTDTPAAITADECVQGNTAGDALTFGACGAGGTTVTANPGSGATDLTTVTIGTTDYTIAPTATAVTAFECVMADVAATTYSAVTNILECDGTPTINEGMFVVEDASGTDTTDRVVIQAAGFYQLIVSLHIDSIASTLRTVAIVSFQLERGGTDTVLADQGTEYVRDSVEAAAVYHTSLVELEVDDRIGVVLQSEAGSASIGIDGSKSYFAIIRTGGPEGRAGRRAPAQTLTAWTCPTRPTCGCGSSPSSRPAAGPLSPSRPPFRSLRKPPSV